jgi:hypothetical protein
MICLGIGMAQKKVTMKKWNQKKDTQVQTNITTHPKQVGFFYYFFSCSSFILMASAIILPSSPPYLQEQVLLPFSAKICFASWIVILINIIENIFDYHLM